MFSETRDGVVGSEPHGLAAVRGHGPYLGVSPVVEVAGRPLSSRVRNELAIGRDGGVVLEHLLGSGARDWFLQLGPSGTSALVEFLRSL